MADQNQEQVNPLDMSDEEFLKQPIPADPVNEQDADTDDSGTTTDDESQGGTGDESNTTTEDSPDGEDAEDGTQTEDGSPADAKDTADARRQEGKSEVDAGGKGGEDKENKPSKSEADDKPGSTDSTATNESVDYEKAYKELMAPFKANGREIQVKSIDDIKQLMQMGANYNKKMQALKPNMRLLKMLENNGLLDESKLSFLIDLDKKNPDAISKLIKESGVNPLDIDEEKANGYKSNNYSVSDKEVELDDVLRNIEDTPTFQKTLTIVGKEWDETSRNTVAQMPQLIELINTHVERGIYDIISKEIESERAMGRLKGLSDFDAYRQVGDAINARGGFDHLAPKENQGQQNPTKAGVVTPNPKKVDEDKLKDKRRAAGASRSAPVQKVPEDFNVLALSDEEFEKLSKRTHLM